MKDKVAFTIIKLRHDFRMKYGDIYSHIKISNLTWQKRRKVLKLIYLTSHVLQILSVILMFYIASLSDSEILTANETVKCCLGVSAFIIILRISTTCFTTEFAKRMRLNQWRQEGLIK